jgi:hypothetical protein
VQGRHVGGQRIGQVGGLPLPVGGARDVELVVGVAVAVQGGDRDGGGFLGVDQVAVGHPGGGQVCAQQPTERVVGQSGEQ